MNYLVDEDGVRIITRITGPEHNVLGLKLSPIPTSDVCIISLKNYDEVDEAQKDLIRQQVSDEIRDFSEKTGEEFYIDTIFFDPSDTYVKNIYAKLTRLILQRIHNNDDFEKIKKLSPK